MPPFGAFLPSALKNLLLLTVTVGLLSPPAGLLQAASPPAPQAIEFPAVKLRGYGLVAGTFTASQINGRSAGTLRIVCQDREKAKLMLAKYLSDLALLQGVRGRKCLFVVPPLGGSRARMPPTMSTWYPGGTTNIGHPLPREVNVRVYEVAEQGAIVALRCGKIVWIFTAARRAHVEQLVKQTIGNEIPDASAPRSQCPCTSTAGTSTASASITVRSSSRRTPIIAKSRPTTRGRISPSRSSRATSGWSCGTRPSARRRPTASSISIRETGSSRRPSKLHLPMGVNIGLEAEQSQPGQPLSRTT